VTKLRGYTLDELNSVPLDKQMAPESFARVVKLYTTELAPERLAQADLPISATLELEMYRKDGSSFWSENTFSLIRDPAGQPLAILGIAHDITESRKNWDALQNSEKRFRALIENNTDAIILVDPRGRVLYESPAYGRMTGHNIRERLGRSSFEFIHPDDRPVIVRILNELVQAPGRVGQATFRNQHLDGSWRWFEGTATNLLGETSVQAVVINMHDITERRQAEENIRQRVTELEVLYETGLHISSLLEPKEIGRKVIEVLSEKLSWRHASVRLVHPGTQRLELLVFNRPGLTAQQLQAETRRLNRIIAKPGQGLSGWVVKHGQPVRSGDVATDPRFIRTFPGIRSALYVPMLVGGRTIGVIGVESESPQAFTEADQRLLNTLAAQAGVAMENARLLVETLRQVEELGALADVSSALRTAILRHEIVTVILDQLMVGLFHNDAACLVAFDPVTGGNIVEAARGKWDKRLGLHLNPGEGLSGRLAETQLPYQSQDVLPGELAAKTEFSDQSEALAGFPLLVQGMFIGSLWIGRTGKKKAQAPVPFSANEMRLLGSVADMAANALQRASLHEQALRHAEELLAVNNMGRLLAETLDLDQIYEKLDDGVWQLLDDICLVVIALYDSENRQITCARFHTDAGLVDAATLPPVPLEPPGQDTQSEAIHTRQPVIFNNLRAQLEKVSFKMEVGSDDGRLTQSGLFVPMLAQGRVIGVMQVQSYTLNRFSQSDAGLLSLVANTAAADIENARLFAETQKRLHNLAALHEIDVAISASVDMNVTLDILLEQTISELHVDAAAVLLLNPLARTLDYAAGLGFHNHQVKGLHIPLGAGLAGQAALQRQIQSASNLPDGLPLQDSQKTPINIYAGEGFLVHYAIPLSAKGQVQGVLEVFLRSPLQPDDEWFAFLETLSRQAAIAIDNSILYDNLQRSNMNIVLAYDATIQGWSQALELRDKETEGHARRVTDRTVLLAQLVGVPAADLEHVRRGTLLHDIGKMGIPDAILLKPGKLTEAEWVIMRRHPVLAYEMLSSIAYLQPALDIPHYHHEKWDGTGYPDGLKGEQIPLYARIFAIVDVYDALTNDRPYRPAWTPTQALEYIRAESGKHFDPAIIEAFLNLIAREN
jgi:PAS domain S-box-containing protein